MENTEQTSPGRRFVDALRRVKKKPEPTPEMPFVDPIERAKEILRDVSAQLDTSMYLSPPFDVWFDTEEKANAAIQDDKLVIRKSVESIDFQLNGLKRVGIDKQFASQNRLIEILAPRNEKPVFMAVNTTKDVRKLLDSSIRPSAPCITAVLRKLGALGESDTVNDIWRLKNDFYRPDDSGTFRGAIRRNIDLLAGREDDGILRVPKSEEVRKKIREVTNVVGFGLMGTLPCNIPGCKTELTMTGFSNGDIYLSISPAIINQMIGQNPSKI